MDAVSFPNFEVKPLDDHVETFTMRSESQSDGNAVLVLEWEQVQVRVPVRATG